MRKPVPRNLLIMISGKSYDTFLNKQFRRNNQVPEPDNDIIIIPHKGRQVSINGDYGCFLASFILQPRQFPETW